MGRLRKSTVDLVFDEGNLYLGEDPIPLMIMVNSLKIIGSNPITYNIDFLIIKQSLLFQMQVKYFKDIIVTRNIENVGVSSKVVIQVISYIVHAHSYDQAENHFNCHIWENLMPNLKRHRLVVQAKAMTIEQSHI